MNHSKYWSTLAITFLAELEYRYGKSVHLSRLSTNQTMFRCLHMSRTADQPDHVPSNGTSDNLGNMAGGIGLPISAFPDRLGNVKPGVVMLITFRVSARIVAVSRAVLSSIASIEVYTVPLVPLNTQHNLVSVNILPNELTT
ncbi:hypothetical protein Trydic_g1828 [Trypoxylus dichotomus]